MKTKGSLRRIAPETRAKIYEAAIEYRKTPRSKLAEELAVKLGKESPSLDTLEKEISKARNHSPSELDRPWSIGACIKYNIPSEIVPVLIQLQEWVYSNDALPFGTLSIRKAKWYALLYPVLYPMNKTSGENPFDKFLRIVIAVEQYNLKDQIAELIGKEYEDTSDLDDTYFIKDGLTADALLVNWANTQLESERVIGRKHVWQKDPDIAEFMREVAERSTQ